MSLVLYLFFFFFFLWLVVAVRRQFFIFRSVSFSGAVSRDGNRHAEQLNRGVSGFRHFVGVTEARRQKEKPGTRKRRVEVSLLLLHPFGTRRLELHSWPTNERTPLQFSLAKHRLTTWSGTSAKGSDSRPQNDVVALGLLLLLLLFPPTPTFI